MYKAFEASGLHLPEYGAVLFTIADETKEEALELAKRFTEIGYSLIGTKHTAAYFEKHGLVVETVAKISEEAAEKNVVDLIRDGKTQVVVNTIDKDRGNASKRRLHYPKRSSRTWYSVVYFFRHSRCDRSSDGIPCIFNQPYLTVYTC